ncbi:hypothetical protein [Joostella sp.]|uniref:hypothetical protein n=1 Tax=Joostella sp. TaxID=2231138 RepID=UPI003A95A841
MRVDIKKKEFYVNLPNNLYKDLSKLVIGKKEISIEYCAFLIHLIIYKSKVNSYVGLSSKRLQQYDYTRNKIRYSYNQQLTFLEKNGFIKIKNHINNISSKQNRCKQYKLSEKYFAHFLELQNKRTFQNKHIVNKHAKERNKRTLNAEERTKHLTKWIDSPLWSIDRSNALEYVKSNFDDSDFERKVLRIRYIENFESELNNYSREGKDDRLHSLFTRIPSDLKQFIKFNNENMVEVDIKSSQPIIASLILDKIVKPFNGNKLSHNELKREINIQLKKMIDNKQQYKININRISEEITTILLNPSKPIDFTETERFIKLIRQHDIYEYVGKELIKDKNVIWTENNRYCTYLYNESKKIQEIHSFETLRECGKKITINALYSSTKSYGIKAVNSFKRLFPNVMSILDCFKIDKSSHLPIFMQQVEAKCVLDYCAKKISRKHPEVLLITRHDSISTTENQGNLLKIKMEILLKDYFSFSPVTILKQW